MAHPSVQHFFRDAQYSTLTEARTNMDKGFALRKRQAADIPKNEAPWRVDPPPASGPTTRNPASRQSLTTNDLIVNAAYHQVMSSANTEPYAVPTSQRTTQSPTTRVTSSQRFLGVNLDVRQARGNLNVDVRQARGSSDYRRLDKLPIAQIEDLPPMEEPSSAPPMPNPDLPPDHWRQGGRGKGKRPPQQSTSRQPAKYARSDDLSIPLPPQRGGSILKSSRSEPQIPQPPNNNGAPEPAPTNRPSTRPKLTMSEAGVPAYKGDEYQPLTRFECKSHYSIRQWILIPNEGVPIADSVLTRILKKISDEPDPHINEADREMSEFVMDRMDQCFSLPEDFIYEVSVNGVKKYRTIYSDLVHAKVAFASTGLYRLLDMKQIARVGDYYYSLRQRPDKKSSSYEYIPNKK